MCGVNLWQHRWGDRADSKCPRCSLAENAQHVSMCQDDAVAVEWVKELKDLSPLFEDLSTCPDTSSSIISNLEFIYAGKPHYHSYEPSSLQTSIDWQNFFESIWHNK